METKDILTAQTVISLKGHDTGRLYIVVAVVSEDFILVADGDKRKLSNPKLKRKKHLRFLKPQEGEGRKELSDALESGKLSDGEIRKHLKKISKGGKYA